MRDVAWQCVAAYESGRREAVEKMTRLAEALEQREAFWGNVMDQVHHRGQLAVYLRLAGGEVPSIYGPSGDEPISSGAS